MDKLLMLEEINGEVQSLRYGDRRKSEELLSRVVVLVEKFFDSKVTYINELYSIRYLLKGINCGGMESQLEIKWEEGKEKLESLISTLGRVIN